MVNQMKGFFRRKQYIIAGALVVIAVIGTTAIYSNKQENERQQMEAEFAEELKSSQEEAAKAAETDTEELHEASALIPPKTGNKAEAAEEVAEAEEPQETETDEEEAQTKNTASTVDPLHFSADTGLTWPMEGDVILNYSMDSTVYFATLDQYKYNPAVVIAGAVNDKVYSVARGQIQGIENDEVTGCTVTVNLGDGYQAIYGQLKELNFDVGDYVEAGHVLGYLAEPTKYFAVEGCNLYFELLKDGLPVDPVEYFQ